MNTDARLDKVHGGYSRILERKLTLAILSKSPTTSKAKKAYNGLIFLPITACATILIGLVRPIEMIASAAIHLVGAAFSKNRKAQLQKGLKFIYVRFPSSIVEAALRVISFPFNVWKSGVKIISSPVRFEEDLNRRHNYEDLNARFEELLKDAIEEKTKDRIKACMDHCRKHIPVSIFEFFMISLIVHREKKVRPEAPRPEMPNAKKSASSSAVQKILLLADKYQIEVSEKTRSEVTEESLGSESKKAALKFVIKRLQLSLHPDKTTRMVKQEREKREEDMKVLNDALGKL